LVGTVASPVAIVKSSATAIAAVMVNLFMAIFRSLRVREIQFYAHRRPKDVMTITRVIRFDIYVMAITALGGPMIIFPSRMDLRQQCEATPAPVPEVLPELFFVSSQTVAV
jgi:hypothetical protein